MHRICLLTLLVAASPLAAQEAIGPETFPPPVDAAVAPPTADAATIASPGSDPAAVAVTGNRSGENAVRQAGDAFGTSIGRETIGLYNKDSVRGFSPVIAGNVRIDGLYFDPIVQPSSRTTRTTTVRIGLSALGSPFPAPTGVVDYKFRRPGDKAAASAILNANSWNTIGIEFDAVVPVADHFSLGLGGSANHEDYFNSTIADKIEGTVIGRWRPSAAVDILPFASVAYTTLDDDGPVYLPAGDVLPPRLPRRVPIGPQWARRRGIDVFGGLLADWNIASDWTLRGGLFRSSQATDRSYTNLIRNIQPDGSASHRIIADPRLSFASTSGEVRLTHGIEDGPRHHQFHAAVRGRIANRRFGGSQVVELGPTTLGSFSTVPRPDFTFGPQQRDKVRQWTVGLAYEGRWDGVGELSAGLQKTSYSKSVGLPGAAPQVTKSNPLLYNITAAAYVGRRLVVYAGAVSGLEESGIAPGNATNRNAALPAISTRQFDIGLRYSITPAVKLIAGAFDIRKPYLNLDANNRYGELGEVRNRGIELSVAGPLTPTLSVVGGAVLLWPKVTGEAVALGRVGDRPVGAISRRLEASADWRPAFAPGVSFDMRVSHRSPETSSVSSLVAIPTRTIVDIGGRYAFRLAGHGTTLRLQIANLFDLQGFELANASVYRQIQGRVLKAYLTVDI